MLREVISSIAAIVLFVSPNSEAPKVSNPVKAVETQAPAPQPPPPAPKPVQVKPKPSWAIPWRIVKCESGGNYRAQNPRSSASGAYQMIQSTANRAAKAIGHPELVGRRASSWPPHLQDQAAAWLWNGGKGKSHWQSCL